MDSLVLVGAPNNGKTRVLKRFWRSHPPIAQDDGETTIPVTMVEAPTPLSEREFYCSIMQAIGVPFRPEDPLSKLRYRAYQLLLVYRVKILIMDEFQHIGSSSPAKQREFLNLMKSLSNRLKISFIIAGTREAVQVMQLDTQFSSRFQPVRIDRWEMGTEWRMLLNTFEGFIPLPEPSNLQHPDFALKLLNEGEKTIGGVWDILKRCARHEILEGGTKITPASLKAIEWIRPSKRIEHARRVRV